MNAFLKLFSLFIIVFISSVSNAVDNFFSENNLVNDVQCAVNVQQYGTYSKGDENVYISDMNCKNAEIVSGRDNKDGLSLSAAAKISFGSFSLKSSLNYLKYKFFNDFDNRLTVELENSINTRAP